MRRVLLWVNQLEEVSWGQTTAMIADRLFEAGAEVYLADVESWWVGRGECLRAWAAPYTPACFGSPPERDSTFTPSGPLVELDLESLDGTWIRTNPARDPERALAHQALLELAHLLASRGQFVWNDPQTLARARSKLFPLTLGTELMGPGRLGAPSHLEAQELKGPWVSKPLFGTWGRGVRLHSSLESWGQTRAELKDPWMLQEFYPKAEEGDLRVLVFLGKTLELEGQVAAIRRIPASGDFRSNIHAGGTAAPGSLDPEQQELVRQIAPKLLGQGIYLAGLDLVGIRLLEVNVFATGGLFDLESFTGLPFARTLASSFLEACG